MGRDTRLHPEPSVDATASAVDCAALGSSRRASFGSPRGRPESLLAPTGPAAKRSSLQHRDEDVLHAAEALARRSDDRRTFVRPCVSGERLVWVLAASPRQLGLLPPRFAAGVLVA